MEIKVQKFYRSQGKPKNPRVCKVCGKTFLIHRWRINSAKYCSMECYNKVRKTAKSYDKKRKCVGCGEEFLPTQWYQKYCSKQCFWDTIRKMKIAICPTCKRTYTKTRRMQKFCSRKCGTPLEKDSKREVKKGMADFLWADLVKLRAGWKCEYCGKKENLNSHHIFSRSNMAVRWDENNGVSLCVGHHVFGKFSAHKDPVEFIEWLRETRGEAWYEKLREDARKITKLTGEDKRGILKILREKIADYEIEFN